MVDRLAVVHAEDLFRTNVAEHADLVNDRLFEWDIASASDKVGLKTI